MAIQLGTLLRYYKRDDVQDAIARAGRDREVAVRFGDGGFGRRPDVLHYPRDVLEFVKQGASSFHCSEERWTNPLQVTTGMRRNELDELRTGWDLILDIDCAWLEYSTVAAQILIEAIQAHGIRTLSVKFSGNHGFHIGVPFEAFPDVVQTRDGVRQIRHLFPEGPRVVAKYLQRQTFDKLGRALLALEGGVEGIIRKTGKPFKELAVERNGTPVLNPFALLAIDTVLIASRHLYRMPYCFNEKSGLVSVPLKVDELPLFDRSWAAPERVTVQLGWLDKTPEPGEARQLFQKAFDDVFEEELRSGTPGPQAAGGQRRGEVQLPEQAIPEEYFPPCIQRILTGLEDGKKRAMFALTNFLRMAGWDAAAIEKRLLAWNEKNPEPLRDNLIISHVKQDARRKPMLPPNCPRAGQSFFADINVCNPDHLCGKVRNPANYAIIKLRMASRAGTQKKEERVEVES